MGPSFVMAALAGLLVVVGIVSGIKIPHTAGKRSLS